MRDILVFAVSVVGLFMIKSEEKVVITPHAREAYKCISEGDLERLRKHPLLLEGNKEAFKSLKYPN